MIELDDRTTWEIVAGHRAAEAVVCRLRAAMGTTGIGRAGRRLVVSVAKTAAGSGVLPKAGIPAGRGDVTCLLPLPDGTDRDVQAMAYAANVICRDALSRGGVLLHGALLARGDDGVVLAGPGGGGKSTAADRAPAPWFCLSDDATLVVRTPEGSYRAHPWPTWSRFLHGREGGTWDVNRSVSLRAIFFLRKSKRERVAPVHPAQAACLLTENAEQIWGRVGYSGDRGGLRQVRLRRFGNVCELARAVPCHELHLSRTGRYWTQVERALGAAPGKDHAAAA